MEFSARHIFKKIVKFKVYVLCVSTKNRTLRLLSFIIVRLENFYCLKIVRVPKFNRALMVFQRRPRG